MEIQNYNELPPGKPSIATFTAYIPALQLALHQMRLIRLKNGNLMVSFPAKMVKDANGQAKFDPYAEMGKERWKDFSKQCLELLEPFMKQEPAF